VTQASKLVVIILPELLNSFNQRPWNFLHFDLSQEPIVFIMYEDSHEFERTPRRDGRQLDAPPATCFIPEKS
jgi:hypothetical protein